MIGCGRGGECISLGRIRRKSLLLAHNPTTGSGFWSLRRLNESQVGIFEEIAPGSCLDLCWAFSRIYNNGGVFPMTGWKRRRRRRRRGPVSGTVHPRLVSATSSLDDGDLGPIRRHPHPPPPPHGHLHPPPHHEPRLVAARPSLGEERPWTWPSNAHVTVSAAI